MIPGAVRFGRGSMIQCCIFFFPPLIVDSKWHLWDTLIKQFFLLLRPGRYFKQIFLFSVFTSLFFFSETQAAFCDPQPRSRLRRKEVSLTWAAWQPLESLARALPPPTRNQIYCWSDFRNPTKVQAHCSQYICQITAPVRAPAQDEFQAGAFVQE